MTIIAASESQCSIVARGRRYTIFLKDKVRLFNEDGTEVIPRFIPFNTYFGWLTGLHPDQVKIAVEWYRIGVETGLRRKLCYA